CSYRRAAAREPDPPARGSISISRFLRESAALPRSLDIPVLQDPAESPFPATPATTFVALLATSRWLRVRLACRRRGPKQRWYFRSPAAAPQAPPSLGRAWSCGNRR